MKIVVLIRSFSLNGKAPMNNTFQFYRWILKLFVGSEFVSRSLRLFVNYFTREFSQTDASKNLLLSKCRIRHVWFYNLIITISGETCTKCDWVWLEKGLFCESARSLGDPSSFFSNRTVLTFWGRSFSYIRKRNSINVLQIC